MSNPIETRTIERDGATYRVSIYPDTDAPNPLEDWDGYGRILSLNRRHGNFDPAGVETALRDDRDAVALSYFEHGGCLWAVAGELPGPCNCPWDSVAMAGVWLPDDATKDESRKYGGRTRRLFMERRARQACKVYTLWCNGGFVGYTVERIAACVCCGSELAEPIGSCWGIDDVEYAIAEAMAAID
jgi:hypothetical protein